MKTILFVVDYFKPHIGGAEVFFDNVIAGLIEEGYKIVVLTSRYKQELLPFESYSYHGKMVDVYRVGHSRYDFMRYACKKGRQLIKQYNVDLIQTTTFNAAVPSARLRFTTKLPTILHVHEIYVHLWHRFLGRKGIFYRFFEWFIFQLTFDHYTCSSLYTQNSIRSHFGIADSNSTVTYCGIDYELWDPTTVDRKSIERLREDHTIQDNYVGLYFGRPGVAKGLTDYLHALPAIIQAIPHFKAFLIVPKGEKSSSGVITSTIADQQVKDLLRSLGVENHVIWIDGIPYKELKNYVMMADIVVLPTLAEGFGLAIAEVCALGKPLVTTRAGSVPEVAGGLVKFVSAGDPEDIARGVVEVFNDNIPSLPLQRFYRGKCVERFVILYNKCL